MSEAVTPHRKDCFWNRNRKTMDITGQKYGRWTVIEKSVKTGTGHTVWLCRCSCGKESVVSLGNLRSGTSTSCGCFKIERTTETKKINLTGRKFGRLTVIKEDTKKRSDKRTRWLCKCDCGVEKTVLSKTLINGMTASCGCFRNDQMTKVCKKFKSKREMKHSPIMGVSIYYSRIPVYDNPKIVSGLATVSCKMCGKYFAPTRIEIERRILAFNGKVQGENNFYCSDNCKKSCTIFHARSDYQDPRIAPKNSEKKQARLCQTANLKQIQCDENNGQSHCEKCGDFIDVELHHTLPIAQFGEKSINSSGHILLCRGCHTTLHSGCK